MKPVLTSSDIDRSLNRMAHEILEKSQKATAILESDSAIHEEHIPALVGIRNRGEYLAKRLASNMKTIMSQDSRYSEIEREPLLGVLDINLYRDDLQRTKEQPVVQETIIDFDINDRCIVLVDDVLYTGRTIRCALDALIDLGRPKVIQLAVLIDRGHRELPIKADFVGKNIPTHHSDQVQVHIHEIDGDDQVLLHSESTGMKRSEN